MSSLPSSGSRSRKAAAAIRHQPAFQLGDLIGGVHRGQPVVQVAPPAVQSHPEQLPPVLGLLLQMRSGFGVDVRWRGLHGEIVH